MSVFRNRGRRVVVDTLVTAEYDSAILGLSETALERLGVSLRSLPISDDDRTFGLVRVRRVGDHEVMFMLGEQGGEIVLTIARIVEPLPEGAWERMLESGEFVATVRGVLGL